MKTSGLTLALLISLGGGSVLAQAIGNAAPQKIVAEVSSTASLSAKSLGATHPTAKPAAANPDTKTTKPMPVGTAAKTKSAAAPQAVTETKAETKATAPPASGASDEPKPEPNTLPFKLNERAESLPPAPSLTGLLLRTFGTLLFIVGLIAAVGWALRYFGIVSFGKPQNETSGLKVMNTLPLGERRSLLTVKFGERTLLIGATPQGLSLLAEQNQSAEIPGNYMPMPPLNTVTDLLGARAEYQFEEELAQASLTDSAWHSRSMR